MTLSLSDLTIDLKYVDAEDILSCWLWLAYNFKAIKMVSKIGDIFYQGKDDAVYWLATDQGKLTKVSKSVADFETMLKDDENIDNWFLPSLIEELIQLKKVLLPNQVYSFKIIPVLGGDYSAENFDATDMSVHFALAGQICEQIVNLPDGTKIKLKVTD